MNSKYITYAVVALVVLGAGIFIYNSRNMSRDTTVSPTPAEQVTQAPQVMAEATPTVSQSLPATTPTPTSGISGQGIITKAGVEEGGTAQLVFISTVGTFMVTDDTKIYDLNGNIATFSYLKKGQLVDVQGEHGEGAPAAKIIKVLKADQPVPTDVVR